ncbi:hypothetical protein GW17_00018542 [Ensete ventricosum]|nr:hypothetical protein GW17_00018542 [Ensete ventricosum]
MAVSLSAAPPVLQDLLFLRPSAGRLSPLPLLRYCPLHSRRRFRRLPSRVVLRSAYDEEVAVTEVSPELDRYVGNGNGGARFGYKEVVNGSTNGSVELILNGNVSTNGDLVKYGGENATIAEDVDKVSEEAKRKKRVEDIGKEDAWFKKDGEQPPVIAEYLQKVDPKSDGAKRDWVAIYDECASVLYQVLTMEYVPGVKINRIQQLDQLGVDRKRRKKKRRRRKPRAVLARASSPPSPVRRHRLCTVARRAPSPARHRCPRVARALSPGERPRPRAIAAHGSPVRCRRASALASFFSRARRRNVSSSGEKDRGDVLQAMIQMGVLLPTGDMTAVRRTAQFFLNSFEERLAAQRKAREMASAELGFKKQLTKEERLEKKKQRLAAIGEAHGLSVCGACNLGL